MAASELGQRELLFRVPVGFFPAGDSVLEALRKYFIVFRIGCADVLVRNRPKKRLTEKRYRCCRSKRSKAGSAPPHFSLAVHARYQMLKCEFLLQYSRKRLSHLSDSPSPDATAKLRPVFPFSLV